MRADEQWEQWAERMCTARTPATAAEAVFAIAEEVGASLARKGTVAREWDQFGLDVDCRPLATSGLCVRGTRRVLVRRGDSLTRRRYTIAHELCHLLLAHAADAGCQDLAPRHEERLCERFASLALIPREQLRAHLRNAPPVSRLDWLRKVANHFRVSLSPLVIALGDIPTLEGDAAFVLARVAPHRLRPRQVALRIAHAAAARSLTLPRDKRLSSLGWGQLCLWAREAAPGSVWPQNECEIELDAGPMAPRGTGSYRGTARCEAIAIAGQYRVVLAFDTGELVARRRPTRRRSRTPATSEQLALALP